MKTVFLKGLCGLSLVMIPEVVLSSSKDNLKSVSPHQYTHLIETYQSQTFEPLSRTALFSEQSASVNSYKTAGVYFITNDKGQKFSSIGSEGEFDDPTGEYCARYGFEVTSCESGLFNKTCPYNDKIYDKCCDETYKYTASQCSAPKKLSADACGDKYQCYCDASTYPHSVCDEPQIKGSVCSDDNGNHYSSCTCPTSVSAPYGCETYYAAPCGTVCQKAYADNCRNRESVQTPYGCEKYFADCGTKCEKAYTDNCHDRIAVSAPYGCESYYADCQSKCEIAYADNCHNRTSVDSSAFGCKEYFADCSSKCKTAYTDNCHNRTAVSAPQGCQKYFADCSSKCEVAKIDNCANKTAVSTPYGCKKTFDDCPSKCEVAYTDNCHNRTAVSDKYGCISYFADCSSKCEKAYTDNCRNRTAVDSSAYGCQKYFADCSSKCEKAYADNCHNRTAVSIPSKSKGICVSYYEDCPSKCSAWGCKENQAKFTINPTSSSRYDECKNLWPILYGDGTVSYKILSDKTPIGVVIDEDKHVAIGLTNIKADGTITLEKVMIKLADAIVACREFEPEGCVSDFCKRGNWEYLTKTQFENIFSTVTNFVNEYNNTMSMLKEVNDTYVRPMWDAGYGNQQPGNQCTEEDFINYPDCKAYGGPVRPIIKY